MNDTTKNTKISLTLDDLKAKRHRQKANFDLMGPLNDSFLKEQ